MNGENTILCQNPSDLARRAAEEFVRLANLYVTENGRFSVVLSGGSTPKSLYTLLATPEFCNSIRWSQVYLFWGDERCVPPDHPDSNYRMAHEALISKVPIPKENIFRMKGERSPQDAADEYEQELIKYFNLTEATLTCFDLILLGLVIKYFNLTEATLTCFDLILLGLGEDGHTASLFPGSIALTETKHLVTAPYVEHLKTHRLTLTLPVLNNSAFIFFLVAGINKAPVLREVLQSESDENDFPAQKINPQKGKLVWFVDRAAANSN